MAHKKTSSYSGLAKTLKKFGLIDYDLRRDLNNGQKAQITKLAGEYKHLISKPEAFISPKVGKKQIEGAKTAGFKTTKQGRVIIPLHGYASAKVKGSQVLYSGGPNGKSEVVRLAGSKEFFRELEALRNGAKKLKRNQIISVSINGNAAFSGRRQSYAELIQYLQEWKPKDKDANREQLFARMSIVTIDDPRAGKINTPEKFDRKSSSRSKRKGKK